MVYYGLILWLEKENDFGREYFPLLIYWIEMNSPYKTFIVCIEEKM